jgi:hypothetical protein
MHTRSIIRQQFVTLLKGATDCGDNVFKQRSRPFIQIEGWATELPAIVVYTNTDPATVYNVAPQTFERVASVVVEIHVAAGEDSDDFLDHVAEQVEILISRYNWEAEDIKFSIGQTAMNLVESGSQINAALAITFPMTYYTDLPDAGKTGLLEDFKTAANTYQIGTATNEQTVEIP